VWFAGRHGGVSASPYATLDVADHVGDDPVAVAENRRRLAAATSRGGPGDLVWLRQVHGNEVVTVERPTAAAPVADAVVTRVAGLPLAVVTADCAPVAIACDDTVAIAHAGHRGLAAGVLERAVARVRAVGRGPVRALLGPCIHPARYEFSAHDLEAFVARFGPGVAGSTQAGRPALDLPAVVRLSLARAGVDQFDDVGVCTAASADHFSHRRDGITGRQASIVVLAP
jgi:YfiH family protein